MDDESYRVFDVIMLYVVDLDKVFEYIYEIYRYKVLVKRDN